MHKNEVGLNEVAEAEKIQIGGKTTITHNSTANSAFWFREDDGALYLEILENAEVSITTTRDIAYTGNYLRVSIAKNAVFNVNTKYGSFRDNGHQASSILVDEGAIFL